MQVSNTTPFKVIPNPGFDQEGREVVSLIVKGTFRVPDRGKVEAEAPENQVEIVTADEYWGAPGQSPVARESELAPFKPGTDLILLGSACATDGRPARHFRVAFSVGDKAKKRRFFSFNKRDRLPLHTVDWKCKEGKWKRSKRMKDGFGFFPKQSVPRVKYAGTYDANWTKKRRPFLPADFDYRFFQGAYPDLICQPHLRGDEFVEIAGMSPGPPVRTVLPGLAIQLEAVIRRDRIATAPHLDTIIAEPDQRRLLLVWRALFKVNGPPSDVKGFVVKCVPLSR